MKKHELPPGVYDRWEVKKAKCTKVDPVAAVKLDEEDEEDFRILDERRVASGDDSENGDYVDDDEDDDGRW